MSVEKKYTLGLYEKSMPNILSLEEKLKIAKDVGYDYVEISIDETEEKLSRLDMPKEERMHLVRTMMDLEMPIRTMCLSGHRKYPLGSSDPAICERSMEIMEKAIQFAEDLGIRIIQLAGYDVYYEQSTPDTVARFEENLNKTVLMAAKAGVVLGFETMETEFMDTVEKCMRYVNLINSAYLNVYPDSGNITNAAVKYGTDVLKDLETGAGHIVALHLKESLPGIYREVKYGEGHVDFYAMINKAWELGVRKYVTEFWYTGNINWHDDLMYAYNLMTGILDKMK